ncbi:hypothetical protein [Idiomarina sp. HP20-50]|uniref:hypothetical protein n=1 Tax=Idiomarina sp. HP20-50 TaxID=3070813 RepID=UPI00294B61EF|nr:hypothetical protein [Idiomarina sp. HP20-50]MDV6314921.1 hypothetical protein [Idiomarina sp. HP20-50]
MINWEQPWQLLNSTVNYFSYCRIFKEEKMKKILGIVTVALLSGCTSMNYSNVNNSQAVISNLKVSELGKAGTKKHQLDVKFDYSIKDYKELTNLYHCSVLFATGKNQLVTTTKEKAPCKIDSKNGSVSIKWTTPLSTSGAYSKEQLSKMQLPLRYHIAIHQKKKKTTSVIIGMSEPLYLAPKM